MLLVVLRVLVLLVLTGMPLRRARQVSTLPSFILALLAPITVVVLLHFLAPALPLPIIKQPVVMLLLVMMLLLLLLLLTLPSLPSSFSSPSSTTFSYL